MAIGVGTSLKLDSHAVVLKNAAGMGAAVAGMEEMVKFLHYMSSREKNTAIRTAYGIATKSYRKALRAATPVAKLTPIKGIQTRRKWRDSSKATGLHKKRVRKLKDTIGFRASKKYKNQQNLINPVVVGHLVSRGAYHQALVVRGRRYLSIKGGDSRKFKKTFRFLTQKGYKHTIRVKKVRPRNYVEPIKNRYEPIMLDKFGDSFVAAMDKRAQAMLKKYYER